MQILSKRTQISQLLPPASTKLNSQVMHEVADASASSAEEMDELVEQDDFGTSWWQGIAPFYKVDN